MHTPYSLAGADTAPAATIAIDGVTDIPDELRSHFDRPNIIDDLGDIPRCPNPLRHPVSAAAWIVRTAFGLVTLVLMLAIVAAIPVLNFWVLGYLLEVEGRVARTGKLRYAFPLLDVTPKIGVIVLGVWIWVFPIRILAGARADANLIEPNAGPARFLSTLTFVLSCFVVLHITGALGRGASFWSFFRPLKNILWLFGRVRHGFDWPAAEARVRTVIRKLRLKHHFKLGFFGFLGAFLWLLLPTTLFAAADKTEGLPILVTVLGGIMLVVLFGWLPFLQARYAAENRFRAMFELGTVREDFKRAPISFLLAIVVAFALALPLYLLKIVAPPQDAMWFVTIVFILSILPARIVTGLAYGRSQRRENRAWFGWRWLSRLIIFAALFAYVVLLFLTQFVAEHGKRALFENHAFLLPVPFS